MAAECFVINKADWDQLMLVFSGMCLLVTFLFVISLVDLDEVVRLVRLDLRRRRIARIRGGRNGR
jgi:hypothetical protein